MTLTVRMVERRPRLEPATSRWRIGLIALATDQTSEQDFAKLRPHGDVAIYVNRMPFNNPTTRGNLVAMQPHLEEAARLILPGEALDAVVYSCTAASALLGYEPVRDAIQAAKPGTAVITPTSAALDAFGALDCRAISVLTPYTDVVTEAIVEYFEKCGMEVLNASCFGLTDDTEIARVAPDFIAEWAESTRHPKAEALFISCTALRAVPVLRELEVRLGIPVVASNQATFWSALRNAGCGLTVQGYGRLLEQPWNAAETGARG